jgi:hypothetical protein
MRREGVCEAEGYWGATCEPIRQLLVFMLTRRAAAFDGAYFALQSAVEFNAVEAEQVLAWLRWHSHEAEVFLYILGLPMSEERKEETCLGENDRRFVNDNLQSKSQKTRRIFKKQCVF